jgi:hypothetical protein
MRAVALVSAVVLAAATGCDSTSTIGSATDVDLGYGSGSDLGMSGSAGCAPEALFVYLLSSNNSLYRFDPGLKQFTLIGRLGCSPPNGATPNSMAVDRNAMAWVNYVSTDSFGMDTGGWIYRVNTRDASCEPTPSITLPSPTWYRIGMGFSTDAAGGSTETLFVSGTSLSGAPNSPGLGMLSLSTKTLVPIRQYQGDAALTGQSAELTGTSAAQLFGFFVTTPLRVAQIEKTTAQILSDLPVNGVATPQSWAFSFWSGSFYLYVSNGTVNSTVKKFDPMTKSVDGSYVLTAPAVITGAGVSTCAPLKPIG